MNKNLKFLAVISVLIIALNIGFVGAQGGSCGPYIKDIFATDIGGTEPLPVVNAGSTIVVNVKLGNLGLQPASGILTVYKRFNLNFAKDSEDTVYLK